jgi:uncharacterized membrane protein HdeD (DUF308 family)
MLLLLWPYNLFRVMQPHITLIKKDSKRWLALLLTGIIFIGVGCYSLLHPFAKNVSISRVFGAIALLTGIIKAVFTYTHKQVISYWKRHILVGFFDVLIGIFLLTFNGIFSLILPFILSFWILSGGISVMEETTDVNLFHTSDIDWLIVGGVLTIVSFFIVAYIPLLGSLAAVFFTTIFIIVVGLFYVALSWRLRSIRKGIQNK